MADSTVEEICDCVNGGGDPNGPDYNRFLLQLLCQMAGAGGAGSLGSIQKTVNSEDAAPDSMDAATLNDAATVDSTNAKTVTFQLYGPGFDGTTVVSFEGSIGAPGANEWFPVWAREESTTDMVQSTTVPGVFDIDVSSRTAVRARVSTIGVGEIEYTTLVSNV